MLQGEEEERTVRERQMGRYRGPGATPCGEATGLKEPGQASVLPLRCVLCPQGEPVNTHVPVLTPTGPAFAAPDGWPLSVPPAPHISEGNPKPAGGQVRGGRGGGCDTQGNPISKACPKSWQDVSTAVWPKSCGESCGGCRACKPPEHDWVLGSHSLQE